MINEDVREIIEAELQPGEKLLWADKPARFPFMVDALVGFFTVFFGAILLVLILVTQLVSGDELSPRYLGPFVFYPLGILGIIICIFFSMYCFSLFQRPNKEIYAVTSERGIIMRPKKTISISPASLLIGERKGDVIGSINFEDLNGLHLSRSYNYSEWYVFHKISQPKVVEKLISNTFIN